MPAPRPEEQIAFLTNIQRILSEGQFTATYKFALLLALADLAVEAGDDSGASLALPTERIAEKFIEYYWRHVVPYVAGPAAAGVILQQNTDKQAAVVNFVRDARMQHGPSLPRFRQNLTAYRALVRCVEGIFWNQPLWRLQRIGEEELRFLYINRSVGTRVDAVELLPGVAFCLRRFHVLITELVRGAWLQYIRRHNAAALGSTSDLAAFLFGSERTDVAALRPVLTEIQGGRCFYCARDLRTGGHLDHFIPWSRYPVDLGHNFVLADDRCNSAKGTLLAAEEHRERWDVRNERHGADIQRSCVAASITADLQASVQIAHWAYAQASAVGGMLWLRGKELRRIGEYVSV